MLKENRIDIKSLIALIIVNLVYLFLIIINSVEGVFGLWIVFLFMSLLPFIIKDKRNIIAIIVFLIPFEVSKTFIPFFQLIEAKDGMFNSVFDLARLFMLYSFIVWVLSDLRGLVPFVKHRITYILAIFIGYYLISSVLISPAMIEGLIETFRYVTYFLFFTMAAQFIRKEQDFNLIWKVLAVVGTVLSLEGILEYVFEYHLWYDNGRRASATFLDPNIFARFLIIVLITLLVLRFKKIYIIKQQFMDLAIVIMGVTLMLTVSRQGIAVFVFVLLFISLFLEKKQRKVIMVGVVIGAIIAFPIFMKLLSARDQALELYDIGQRAGLLMGGSQMFLGSPLVGIGAEGFQTVMIGNYYDLLPWGINGDTLSHTYVLTILAELGFVGFLIFCSFLWLIYKQFKINYSSQNEKLKAYALIIFASIVALVVSSQAEGRFFEEPMLWLFLGLHVALGRIVSKDNTNILSG
jgi:O-Antigen ligase